MRVAVTGGRSYDGDVAAVLDKFDISELILGDAMGADRLALSYAISKGIYHTIYRANWKAYRKQAGIIRNGQMLTQGRPDLVVAFPGGKGTANMVSQARSRLIPIFEAAK